MASSPDESPVHQEDGGNAEEEHQPDSLSKQGPQKQDSNFESPDNAGHETSVTMNSDNNNKSNSDKAERTVEDEGDSTNNFDDSIDYEGDADDSILSVSFNQDGGCLAVGTRRGFRICNVSPFQETFRRTFAAKSLDTTMEESGAAGRAATSTTAVSSNGGIAAVEMLFRCNLLALVGGGPSPKYPPNKIIMWDDYRAKPIGELSFRQRVLSVKLRRDRIAVALTNRVYVYNFADLTLLDQIPTCTNPRGLLCMSSDAGAALGVVVACPGMTRGHVRVELYHLRKTVQVEAHETQLAQIGLSMDGSLLATASEKGTLIRLFDTRRGGAPLRELRRGVERASISCIAISRACDYVGVTSDRGTVHIFRVPSHEGRTSNSSRSNHSTPSSDPRSDSRTPSSKNPSSTSTIQSPLTSWTKFTRHLTLGEGDTSFAQVRNLEDAILCSFLPDHLHRIAVVNRDGSLVISDFSNGGEAERVSFHRFFKTGDRFNSSTSKWGSSKNGFDGIANYPCGGVVNVDSACGNASAAGANGSESDVITSDDMHQCGEDDGAVHQGIIFGEDEQEEGFVSVEDGRRHGR